MYINFKSKYKKILWFLIGFMFACFVLTDKVLALPTFGGTEQQYNFNNFNFVYNNHTYNKAYIFELLNTNLVQHNKSFDDYKLIFINVPTQPTTSQYDVRGFIDISLISNDNIDFFRWGNSWNSAQFIFTTQVSSAYFRISLNTGEIYNYTYSNPDVSQSVNIYCGQNSSNTTNIYTNYVMDWSKNQSTSSNTIYSNFYYDSNILSFSSLPDYLSGYQKITLTTDDKYYMLSGLSSGSIFIPLEDFNSIGGRLSYYDNDLSSQPYTSYIQDYTITSDGLYARQDFNLNDYYGADFVMFSKYIYLEGEDNITYDIWVPEDITYSDVTITPNSSGGNNFDFQYKDSNGNIQNATISSVDLTPPQPLLSDVFTNFTTNYYGLSSIITSPISFLQSLNNSTCTPLNIPNPIGGGSFTAPCMTTIYETYGGDFFTLYQTITTGFIAYYVGLGYFNLIKGLKDPSDDRIEVIHL